MLHTTLIQHKIAVRSQPHAYTILSPTPTTPGSDICSDISSCNKGLFTRFKYSFTLSERSLTEFSIV